MIQKKFMSVKKTLSYHGLAKAILFFLYITANKFFYLRLLKGLIITPADIKCSHRVESKYVFKFASEQELEIAYKGMPGSDDFLHNALQRGDECYSVFYNDRLISYGWYSRSPNPIDPNLTLYFNNQYVYMYNGYTCNDYRGQRLHGIGMAKALDHYREMGHKGLISYVDRLNFSSLSSCYKLGYKPFGNIIIIKLFGQYIIYHSDGCADYGFRIEIKDRFSNPAEVFLTDKNKAL